MSITTQPRRTEANRGKAQTQADVHSVLAGLSKLHLARCIGILIVPTSLSQKMSGQSLVGVKGRDRRDACRLAPRGVCLWTLRQWANQQNGTQGYRSTEVRRVRGNVRDLAPLVLRNPAPILQLTHARLQMRAHARAHDRARIVLRPPARAHDAPIRMESSFLENNYLHGSTLNWNGHKKMPNTVARL